LYTKLDVFLLHKKSSWHSPTRHQGSQPALPGIGMAPGLARQAGRLSMAVSP